MENQEVLDTMKTENTKTPDVVTITFGYNEDFTFDSVVGFAKQFPTYQTKGEGKERKHGVVFQIVSYEIATVALKMWQLVEDWDTSALRINRELAAVDNLIACREKLSDKPLPTQEVTPETNANTNTVTVEEPNWAVDPPGVVVETLVAAQAGASTSPATDGLQQTPVNNAIANTAQIAHNLGAQNPNSQNSMGADANPNPLTGSDLQPIDGDLAQAPTEQNLIGTDTQPKLVSSTPELQSTESIVSNSMPEQQHAQTENIVIPAPLIADATVPELNIASAQIPNASIKEKLDEANATEVPVTANLITSDLNTNNVTDTITEPQGVNHPQMLTGSVSAELETVPVVRPESVPPMSTSETAAMVDLTGPSAFMPSNTPSAPSSTPAIPDLQVAPSEFPRPLAEPIVAASGSITEPTLALSDQPSIELNNAAENMQDLQVNSLQAQQLTIPPLAANTANAVMNQQMNAISSQNPQQVQQQVLPQQPLGNMPPLLDLDAAEQTPELLGNAPFSVNNSTPDVFAQLQKAQEENSTMNIAGNPQIPTQVSEATVATDSGHFTPLHSPDLATSEVATSPADGQPSHLVNPLAQTSVNPESDATQTNLDAVGIITNNIVADNSVIATPPVVPAATLGIQNQDANLPQQAVMQSQQQSIDGIHPDAFAKPIPVTPQVSLENQQNASNGQFIEPKQNNQAIAAQQMQVASEHIANAQQNLEGHNLITPDNDLNIPATEFSALAGNMGGSTEQPQLATVPQNSETAVTVGRYPTQMDIEESTDTEAFSFSEISVGRFPGTTKESLHDASFAPQVHDTIGTHREIDLGIGELPASMQNEIEQTTQPAVTENFDDGSEDLGLKTVIDERDAKPIWRKLLGGKS